MLKADHQIYLKYFTFICEDKFNCCRQRFGEGFHFCLKFRPRMDVKKQRAHHLIWSLPPLTNTTAHGLKVLSLFPGSLIKYIFNFAQEQQRKSLWNLMRSRAKTSPVCLGV